MIGIRQLFQPQPKPYDDGILVSDTGKHYECWPQLSTLGRTDLSEPIQLTTEKQMPSQVTLRLRMAPLPLQKRSTAASLMINNRSFKPCRFYERQDVQRQNHDIFEKTLWEGINLIFDGSGVYKHDEKDHPFQGHLTPLFHLTCKPDESLSVYSFILPDQKYYHQVQTSYQKKHWFTQLDSYASGVNIVPLIPYAGYIPTPLDLTKICQTYALLVDVDQQHTKLALYTQNFCHYKKIQLSLPDQPSRYKVCTALQHLSTISLSLAGWLMKGYLKIALKSPDTETIVPYQSKNFRQTDLASHVVDVVFVPQ